MTRTHSTLAALASLGLAVALPRVAQAQALRLNDGDVITVSGAGTVGTINNMPVADPAATSYSTSALGGAAVETDGSSTFTLGAGGALNAGPGGLGLYEHGSGPVTVSGGSITAGDNGTGLYGTGGGPITVSGGTFTAGQNGYGLFADGISTFTVSGGVITAGPGGDGLIAGTRGTINLYGQFTDPSGVALTVGQTESLPSDPVTGDTGSFFGTLENNTVGQTFTFDNFGTITLHDVGLTAPEPSAFAGFALGVLGLGGLALRARRRA